MILYAVVYNHGLNVVPIHNAENLRRMGKKHTFMQDDRYGFTVKSSMGLYQFYGPIYNGGQLFTTEAAAHAYIAKDYSKSFEYRWQGIA